ncbi:Uncharacterized protein EJ110_NYTH18415 [Nymphaea thermarum]|nr:Uncharacterized protein EJ110_NYTH18415 [Nymphaea thermarum]
MGCVASGLIADELNKEADPTNGHGGHSISHIVSLTSTTYGLLTLDSPCSKPPDKGSRRFALSLAPSPPTARIVFHRTTPSAGAAAATEPQAPEVINAWELMDGLDGDAAVKVASPCPPVGEKAVVFYSTTLGGIRKTFEDCNRVRAVLEGLGVAVSERDVSMHSAYKEELRGLLVAVAGGGMQPQGAGVPRVFIKGQHVGGAEEVVSMHEEGRLAAMVEGLPRARAGEVCEGCGGVRFVPCFECNGSRKLVTDKCKMALRCPECNENGLVLCPICC